MDNTVIFRVIFAPTVKNYHSTPTVNSYSGQR
jgi:hypothetical protein